MLIVRGSFTPARIIFFRTAVVRRSGADQTTVLWFVSGPIANLL
ncbi:MAG TPA: hypothetical protein VJS37_17695 [Terriglobales bacterium]|nr:hypothetical protein [Terriglobales bacterium]